MHGLGHLKYCLIFFIFISPIIKKRVCLRVFFGGPKLNQNFCQCFFCKKTPFCSGKLLSWKNVFEASTIWDRWNQCEIALWRKYHKCCFCPKSCHTKLKMSDKRWWPFSNWPKWFFLLPETKKKLHFGKSWWKIFPPDLLPIYKKNCLS